MKMVLGLLLLGVLVGMMNVVAVLIGVETRRIVPSKRLASSGVRALKKIGETILEPVVPELGSPRV